MEEAGIQVEEGPLIQDVAVVDVAVEVVAVEIKQLQQHLNLLSQDRKFSFIDRLCQENNWSKHFAQECIDEYIKFLYLIIHSQQELTPSDEVDQVWHLHLQYSRSYQKMCEEIGFFIHHEPTKGGRSQKNKFDIQYEKTKKIYEEILGTKPPVHIWDSAESRFKIKPQSVRVNRYYNWIINKSSLIQILGASILLFIGVVLILLP